MSTTHVRNPTWINSISPELCPPLTCERACSGNQIILHWALKWHVCNFTLNDWTLYSLSKCSFIQGESLLWISPLKLSWGGRPPYPPPKANSCRRYSAHTLGNRIYYPGGRVRKMGPLVVLPHHWRILKKNALELWSGHINLGLRRVQCVVWRLHSALYIITIELSQVGIIVDKFFS
jgi:hypothetical protein